MIDDWGIGVQVTGLKELNRVLLRLERKDGRAVVRDALRIATQPVQNVTKICAKRMVGGKMGDLLSRNIIVRAAKRKRPHEYRLLVMTKPDVPEFVGYSKGSASSIKSKKLVSGTRYYIPAAIEFGHAFPGRGGSGAKDIAPIPFMRSAADAKEDESRRLFIYRINQGISGVCAGYAHGGFTKA